MSTTDTCYFCGKGSLVERKVEHIMKKNGNRYIFTEVPANVCEFCGEKYFDAKVVEGLEELIHAVESGKQDHEEVKLPLIRFKAS